MKKQYTDAEIDAVIAALRENEEGLSDGFEFYSGYGGRDLREIAVEILKAIDKAKQDQTK